MKRALLIVGGTVGGIGAVLSITPLQLSAQGMSSLGETVGTVNTVNTVAIVTKPVHFTNSATATAVATATPTAKPVIVKKKVIKKKDVVRKAAKRTTPKKSLAPSIAASAAASVSVGVTAPASPAKSAAPVVKGISGTFAGVSNDVYHFGSVQVQITVVDGKITDARALQSPNDGRSGEISMMAIPMLREQTLAAQSSKIQGVSGASYTSWNWYTSLQSALKKAGLAL